MREMARRPNFLVKFVSCLLVASTAPASGQSNASVRLDMPKIPSPPMQPSKFPCRTSRILRCSGNRYATASCTCL